MNRSIPGALVPVALAISTAAMGQGAPLAPPVSAPPPSAQEFPAPSEIVAAAPTGDWVTIAASDLLIMTLSPDPRGGAGRTGERRVIIQLMPRPFSEGWVANIRNLATAHWWDGLAIVRVQDNYVAQWGDPDAEDAGRARALPAGLRTMVDADYLTAVTRDTAKALNDLIATAISGALPHGEERARRGGMDDPYSGFTGFVAGWPIGSSTDAMWPVHCYGMVGVGRNLSPDTGSGAELYTVIGHAPRHLDRNIALVGRVIEGMEHLSSLPRGTEALGFYTTAEQRTGITSVRLASELPVADQPHFQYLSTESATFTRYADARANRRDPFFNVPAGGADICNIPVPIRRAPR